MTKICRVCAETKPISEYYRAYVNADGYENRCKRCKNAAIALYVAAHPEVQERRRERQRKWQKANREQHAATQLAWAHANLSIAARSLRVLPQAPRPQIRRGSHRPVEPWRFERQEKPPTDLRTLQRQKGRKASSRLRQEPGSAGLRIARTMTDPLTPWDWPLGTEMAKRLRERDDTLSHQAAALIERLVATLASWEAAAAIVRGSMRQPEPPEQRDAICNVFTNAPPSAPPHGSKAP